jgi:hypothetical protein
MSIAPRPSRPPPVEREPVRDYEFSEGDKESFRALAQSMSFVGVSLLLLGGLGGTIFGFVAFSEGFVGTGFGVLVAAAAWLPMAWWTMSAGRSLGALVRTHGRDVVRLMEAVKQLRLLFAFTRIVIIVCALLVVLFAGAVVWCTLLGATSGKCFGLFG